MKKNFLSILLITGIILTLTSCASRKYGCPATVKAGEPVTEARV